MLLGDIFSQGPQCHDVSQVRLDFADDARVQSIGDPGVIPDEAPPSTLCAMLLCTSARSELEFGSSFWKISTVLLSADDSRDIDSNTRDPEIWTGIGDVTPCLSKGHRLSAVSLEFLPCGSKGCSSSELFLSRRHPHNATSRLGGPARPNVASDPRVRVLCCWRATRQTLGGRLLPSRSTGYAVVFALIRASVKVDCGVVLKPSIKSLLRWKFQTSPCCWC